MDHNSYMPNGVNHLPPRAQFVLFPYKNKWNRYTKSSSKQKIKIFSLGSFLYVYRLQSQCLASGIFYRITPLEG